jgi:hypothetical protein
LLHIITGVGLPPDPTALPVQPIPVTDRNVDLEVFDPAYTTPYVQNFTASLTHTLSSKLSFDVRYIGTLSRKLTNSFNLNVANIFQNGLFEALEAARSGGESQLLDDMFAGIDMRTGGPTPRIVGQNGLTGAGLLRTDNRFSGNLANGSYIPVAEGLATLNYVAAFNPSLPAPASGTNGWVLRANNFPENFILTSPQFDDAELRTNMGYRNYHSMQAQFTVRPSYGISTSVSYTWAKDLGNNGNYTVPWDRALDYDLSGNSRAHSFRSYGTFNLPIGPNQLLLRDSTGLVARLTEGWQLSWIYNIESGAPLQLNSLRPGWYNNSHPVLVDSSLFDAKAGKVTWEDGAQNGSYFSGYERGDDPQCTDTSIVNGPASFVSQCTLDALYHTATGALVFRTPRPGEFGNYRDQVFGPGRWTLDMSASKKFRLNEEMSLDLRVDATNVFNHATPNNPNLDLQSGNTDFGAITSKSSSFVQFSETGRVFAGRLRLSW